MLRHCGSVERLDRKTLSMVQAEPCPIHILAIWILPFSLSLHICKWS